MMPIMVAKAGSFRKLISEQVMELYMPLDTSTRFRDKNKASLNARQAMTIKVAVLNWPVCYCSPNHDTVCEFSKYENRIHAFINTILFA